MNITETIFYIGMIARFKGNISIITIRESKSLFDIIYYRSVAVFYN